MIDVDFEALENAVRSVLDESVIDKYDFDTILLSAQLVWADTAVMVTASDFMVVVDRVSYEVLDYTGLDA